MNKYKVIYADPPWAYKTYSDKGKGKSADNHYSCMDLEEIKALPVSDLADDNCVLLMWTTDPFLEKSFEVIKAWGFTYKTTGFVWVKLNKSGKGIFTGLGHWSRSCPEYCILATKGKPKRRSASVHKVVMTPVREHSRKPDEMYGKIEELLEGPYIELFARTRMPGWDVEFSKQSDKFTGSVVQTDDGHHDLETWAKVLRG